MKYDSSRDEVLHSMALQGWSNKSDGDVECPTGYFSLICNSTGELEQILGPFSGEIASAELTDTNELIGNFLVIEDSQGFVHVWEYATVLAAQAEYRELENEYVNWSAGSASEAKRMASHFYGSDNMHPVHVVKRVRGNARNRNWLFD